MVFPSHPYIIAQQDTLIYRVHNFGNYDEEIPATIRFRNNYWDIMTSTVQRKGHYDYYYTFTPTREELVILQFWTNLQNDAIRINDTFPVHPIYIFPKYTTYGEDFDFTTLSSAGWSVFNLDGDGGTWAIYTHYASSPYIHSGWYTAGCYRDTAGNNDWLISPAINVSAGAVNSFGFYARALTEDSLEVWILSQPNPDSVIEMVFAKRLTGLYTRYTFSLDKFRGQTAYVGFRMVGPGNGYVFVDDYFVRQVPLTENRVLWEEFEEGLIPPGWSEIFGSGLWLGGTPSEAGVPDNGTGALIYFNSSAPAGSYSGFVSPEFRVNSQSGCISYKFNYYNYDGNDSVQIYYRINGSDWIYHGTITTTNGAWGTIIGGPVYLPQNKAICDIQFSLLAFSDRGGSNIAVDNFEVVDGTLLDVTEPAAKPEIKILESRGGIGLRVDNLKKGVNVQVYDAMGRKVRELNLDKSGEYVIGDLPRGIYFVSISCDVKKGKRVIVVK